MRSSIMLSVVLVVGCEKPKADAVQPTSVKTVHVVAAKSLDREGRTEQGERFLKHFRKNGGVLMMQKTPRVGDFVQFPDTGVQVKAIADDSTIIVGFDESLLVVHGVESRFYKVGASFINASVFEVVREEYGKLRLERVRTEEFMEDLKDN